MKLNRFRFSSIWSIGMALMLPLNLGLIVTAKLAPNFAFGRAPDNAVEDVFAPYDALKPGRLLAALDVPDCQVDLNSTGRSLNWKACAFRPDDGPFNWISVTADSDRIGEVSFYSETLQLDALIAKWQEPDRRRRDASGQIITLYWDHRDYRISAVVYLLRQRPHVQAVYLNAP